MRPPEGRSLRDESPVSWEIPSQVATFSRAMFDFQRLSEVQMGQLEAPLRVCIRIRICHVVLSQ